VTDAALLDRPTHCPTCGVKLPDIPVSLCAYCASPVSMPGKVHGGPDSPNQGRIGKIAAHKTYADVLAYVPPESPSYLVGMRLRWHGRNLAILGALMAGWGAWQAGWVSTWFWLGAAALLLGLVLWSKGRTRCAQAIAEPISKRPGMIVDRRSETAIRSWNGETVYFFTIEFEGGGVGEYRFEGRGASEDPYPSGMTGVAFLRGTELLEFRQIRV